MDEFSVSGDAHGASGSGDGGAETDRSGGDCTRDQFVVDFEASSDELACESMLVCFTKSIGCEVLSRIDQSVGGSNGMKDFFFRRIYPLFQSQGFSEGDVYSSVISVFRSFPCTREIGGASVRHFMGHTIFMKDSVGKFMVLFYTTDVENGCRGVVGYSPRPDLFLRQMKSENKMFNEVIESASRYFIDKPVVDDEYHETLQSIRIPIERRTGVTFNHSLYSKSFKASFPSIFEGRHPYSGVVNYTVTLICNLFNTFHNSCFDKEQEKVENSEIKNKILFAYRVTVDTCRNLTVFEEELVADGGSGTRQMLVFDLRRTINYLKWRMRKLMGDSNFTGFFNKISEIVFEIFRLSKECVLFKVVGKSLMAESDREERYMRHKNTKRKRKTDSDEDDDEDDTDEEELILWNLHDVLSGFKSTEDFEVDDDDEGRFDRSTFDADIEKQIELYFLTFSRELRKLTSDLVLQAHTREQALDSTIADNLLITSELLKVVYQYVNKGILYAQYMPDFLSRINIPRGKLEEFFGHFQVLCNRFPDCVWTSSADLDHRSNLCAFCTSLEDSGGTSVAMPSNQALLAASRKILQFLGQTCPRGEEVMSAVKLVNDGMLGVKPRSKSRANARNKGRAVQPLSSSLSGPVSGGDGEASEIGSAGRKSRGSSKSHEQADGLEGQVGLRILSEVNPDLVLLPDAGGRVRRSVDRYSNDGKTTQKSLFEGWDIPALSGLKRLAALDSGEKMDSRAKSYFDKAVEDLAQSDLSLFLCPDYRELNLSEITHEKKVMNLSYAKCKVYMFEYGSGDLDKFFFAMIEYKSPPHSSIFVDVDLLLENDDRSVKKKVAIRKIESEIYVYKITTGQPKKKRRNPFHGSATQDATAGGGALTFQQGGAAAGGAGSSLRFITDPPQDDGVLIDSAFTDSPALGRNTAPRISALTGALSASTRGSKERHSSQKNESVSASLRTLPHFDEKVDNLLECGEYVFGKFEEHSLEVKVIGPKELYRLWLDCQKEASKVRRSKQIQVSYAESDDDSDSGRLKTTHDDDDEEFDGGDEADEPPVSKPSTSVERVDDLPDDPVPHSNAPWKSFIEMEKFARESGWELLNSVDEYGLIYNSSSNDVLIVPFEKLSMSANVCVYAFLNQCPEDSRVVYGPIYLQHQEKSEISSLYTWSIDKICNRLVNPSSFFVFEGRECDGGRINISSLNMNLIEHSSKLIVGFDEANARYISLFQLCPMNTATGNPLRHEHPMCYFALNRSCSVDSDFTTLDDRMNLHSRPKRIITNASAVACRAPGCKCLFEDIKSRQFCVYLLGEKDSVHGLHALKNYVAYCIQIFDGKESIGWIRSSKSAKSGKISTPRKGDDGQA